MYICSVRFSTFRAMNNHQIKTMYSKYVCVCCVCTIFFQKTTTPSVNQSKCVFQPVHSFIRFIRSASFQMIHTYTHTLRSAAATHRNNITSSALKQKQQQNCRLQIVYTHQEQQENAAIFPPPPSSSSSVTFSECNFVRTCLKNYLVQRDNFRDFCAVFVLSLSRFTFLPIC